MTAEFAAAFLAAQREFPTINKGRTATIETNRGSYSYTYADLGDVLDSVLPILHANGLSLSQPLVSSGGVVGVGTRLYHESGHVEDFGELLLPAGNTPQTAGSALTYARRYAACAALGIVADEDDDGRAASSSTDADTLSEYIAGVVADFMLWNDEDKRTAWKRHAAEVLGGKPQTTAEADMVIQSMRDEYEKQFEIGATDA